MTDIPAPGTWVRLEHAGSPAGSWHHVTNSADGQLEFHCKGHDGDISWALLGIGAWTLLCSREQPARGVCRTCSFRAAFIGSAAPLVLTSA